MKDIKVRKKLEQTLSKLNKTYDTINLGGCGYFAKELGTTLKNRGYKVKYVLLLCDKRHINEAEWYIHNLDLKALHQLSWRHVMVKVEGKLYDSEGLYNKVDEKYKDERRKYYGINLPEHVLSKWLKDHKEHWNPTFDRKLVPKIKKMLNKNLVI